MLCFQHGFHLASMVAVASEEPSSVLAAPPAELLLPPPPLDDGPKLLGHPPVDIPLEVHHLPTAATLQLSAFCRKKPLPILLPYLWPPKDAVAINLYAACMTMATCRKRWQ